MKLQCIVEGKTYIGATGKLRHVTTVMRNHAGIPTALRYITGSESRPKTHIGWADTFARWAKREVPTEPEQREAIEAELEGRQEAGL